MQLSFRWGICGGDIPGAIQELDGEYRPFVLDAATGDPMLQPLAQGELSAEQLLALYCPRLYPDLGSYEGVARRIGLDRRTVRKYVELDRG